MRGIFWMNMRRQGSIHKKTVRLFRSANTYTGVGGPDSCQLYRQGRGIRPGPVCITYALLIPKPVKKLEKLFIAPKVRQVLYGTSQRALARCACAQRTGFLIKFFNQESVLEEELLDLAVQHQQHGQGGNVLDADPEPAVGSEFLPLAGGLGVDYLGPELPAVHNAHQ